MLQVVPAMGFGRPSALQKVVGETAKPAIADGGGGGVTATGCHLPSLPRMCPLATSPIMQSFISLSRPFIRLVCAEGPADDRRESVDCPSALVCGHQSAGLPGAFRGPCGHELAAPFVVGRTGGFVLPCDRGGAQYPTAFAPKVAWAVVYPSNFNCSMRPLREKESYSR